MGHKDHHIYIDRWNMLPTGILKLEFSILLGSQSVLNKTSMNILFLSISGFFGQIILQIG